MFEKFDFAKMGEMLNAAQEQAQKLQEQAAAKEYSVKSGGGLISIKANGIGEVLDINIDDSLLQDKDSLQILLISAVNDVFKMIEDDKKAMASNMLGDISGFGRFNS